MKTLSAAIAGTDTTAIFEALAQVVRNTLQVRLFTVMEIDPERGVASRSYSNMPDVYPTSGEKPMMQNAWSDVVQGQRQTFVANSYEEIAEVFADHELIQSLGCESCLNLPIVVNGQVLGTLNCLDEAGFFTPERVALAQSLQPAGALALLAADRVRETAEPVAMPLVAGQSA